MFRLDVANTGIVFHLFQPASGFVPDPGRLQSGQSHGPRDEPGGAKTLDEDHSATLALSRTSETMDRVDLWHARLAMKTLSNERREAIAAADIVI